ncbi:imm11 family protein [Psychromonas algicola]|uniref:imm11 family protein n=1 Tax=Psychromonas algicola TaxID=2555642 RepID=UPI001068A29C|nr:DUF1629 domain-containing protein [Psychromonas sp. RZ5]TEW51228.1 hypothetical protein E2R67_08385 [Psychromonas sp. RZ5]
MNYYRINVHKREDEDFCFLTRPPEKINLLSSYIVKGISATSRYPEDVVAKMPADRGGIYPSDIISNRNLCLIVVSEIKEIIQEFCGESCEYLPVKIQNHRERIEKKNYFYINPLGSFDCLDKEKSVIEYNSEGKVIVVEHFVFDQKKMATLPDIFRVKESEKKYFINQRLVDEIKRRLPNLTNLNLEPIEVV